MSLCNIYVSSPLAMLCSTFQLLGTVVNLLKKEPYVFVLPGASVLEGRSAQWTKLLWLENMGHSGSLEEHTYVL